MLNALLTIAALQLLTMLVLLVRTKTLALLLGPDGVGVLGLVDKLLATVAQTISLSLPFAAVRFLPELWSQNQDEFVSLIRRMRNLLILLALTATGFGLAATAFFPQIWGRELLPYRSILFPAFLSLPVIMFVAFLQNAIAGRLAHNASVLFALGHAAVLTLTGILGVWWMGLGGLYVLYAVFGIMLVVPALRLTERVPSKMAQGRRNRRPSISLPRRVWKFSLALWGLAFMAPFAALYVHYQVLGRFGAETAGWMQAAMGLGLVVRSLLGSAHPIFLTPNVNRGGSPQERMRWAGEFQKTFSFVCTTAVIPLLLFPDILVTLLYSPNFLPAARFAALFVIGEVLILLTGTYQALVIAFDHIAFHVTQNLLAQGVLLTIATFLIEPYGIFGVGLAGISAQVVLYSGSTLFLGWRYGLRIPLRNSLLTLFIVVSLGLAGLVGALYPAFSLEVVLGKVSLYGILITGLGLFLTSADRANLFHLTREAWTHLQSVGTFGRY
jgi:O-antigen/teichoic acid export membrane protein